MDELHPDQIRLRDLTNADVQALAKKILADGNLVKVVMRPSK